MALTVILKKLKSFLLFIVAIWKRMLCCFRRRRKPSLFEPLTEIDIVLNQNDAKETENWVNWDEQITVTSNKPTTIQEHIEFYRQQAIAARQVQQDETPQVQENFFEDMTPTITRQTKLLINNKKEDHVYTSTTNRLSLVPDGINIVGQELGEWDDNRGWEDQTLDWDAREALKESRKQARQKKVWEQQQKKQEKNMRPVLGAKVSS